MPSMWINYGQVSGKLLIQFVFYFCISTKLRVRLQKHGVIFNVDTLNLHCVFIQYQLDYEPRANFASNQPCSLYG